MFLCTRCKERLSYSDSSSIGDKGVCDLCGNVLERIDDYFEMFSEEARHYDFSTFLIGLRTPRENLLREKEIIEKSGRNVKSYKEEFQVALGSKIERELHYRAEFAKPELTFIVNQENMDYSLWIKPLFLRGRYVKKRRGIPQSPWIKPGKGKEMERSISEYIGQPICDALDGRDYNFFASGREDVDALMLGTGRPFYVEVKNPKKRSVDITKVSEEVQRKSGDGVEVLELSPADSVEIDHMKNLRSDKVYEVGITIEGKNIGDIEEVLKNHTDFKISQRTPLRVLNIRKDKVRDRTIRSIDVKSTSGKQLILLIKAEAGTYIKEFITGDNGRTVPNLKDELDVNVKIDYLNVLEVK
ncbi:MAG: tRNA pseudouridine(54/55) synthase Pus10 [Candidatus Thermoplasmatota archaeon]|nr:tRNA pseudouridine(54/55) synthase Pus10 [Candidatus Thermoplasmatota archaeon]